MGVEKTVVSQGNGQDTPRKGDTVTMEYTGWLYDTSKPENKGKKFVLDP
jgi:FK506-binding protein 1